MSNTHWRAFLLGGSCGTDGLLNFRRPVLFSDAAAHMLREMPEDWMGIYVREQTEAPLCAEDCVCPEQATFSQKLEVMLPKDGTVFLCTIPVPTLERREYLRLQQQHRQSGSEVTVLLCGAQIPVAAACDAAFLARMLAKRPHSLEQLLALCQHKQARVSDCTAEHHPAVRSAYEAFQAQSLLMERTAGELMRRGVMLFDPQHTWIAPDAQIGAGTTLLPGTMIYPNCRIGPGCTVGPNAVLRQTVLDARTMVNASQILQSTVGDDVSIGPFAYIRPHCTIGSKTKIGDFVELKNATIGARTMVSHLTYLGDAQVGERVNFGCGTVVVNYDGFDKHQTVIGDDCFIGCNTNLVAPVHLGDRVLTAAGSTVTDSVPDGAMAVARARQETKNGWNDRRLQRRGREQAGQQ